jgi:uncharacterized protein
MPDREFEWDDPRRPRIGAAMALCSINAEALSDPFATEEIDDREDYGEERINALGMRRGVLLHAAR